MIERAVKQDGQTTHGPAYWLSIEIQPKRVLLFRRWARHLGLSDADLAAQIFTEGTIQLALEYLAGLPTADTPDEDARHLERLLDDLDRSLPSAIAAKEGPDAPDHH